MICIEICDTFFIKARDALLISLEDSADFSGKLKHLQIFRMRRKMLYKYVYLFI